MTVRDEFDKLVHRALGFESYSRSPEPTCPFLPDHVHIEPTNACNLRCIHCHHSRRGDRFTNKLGLMDYDLFTRVIDEICHWASRITLDAQGEPLLHRRIVSMVRYASESGLSVSLLTNATRLTASLGRRLIDAGLSRVVFSIDAVDAGLYESIRVNSRFAPTMLNILEFLNCNEDAGHRVFVCASMVHQSANRDHVQAYRDYFQALPVDDVFISPLLSLSGGSQIADEVDLSMFETTACADLPCCRTPWQCMVVGWDGRVLPCPLDYNAGHVIGDVRHDSLQTIWNGAAMQAFRLAMIEGDNAAIAAQGPLCESCNYRFDPEYDMANMTEFTARYLVRQAQVFAPRFVQSRAGTGEQVSGADRLSVLAIRLAALRRGLSDE